MHMSLLIVITYTLGFLILRSSANEPMLRLWILLRKVNRGLSRFGESPVERLAFFSL